MRGKQLFAVVGTVLGIACAGVGAARAGSTATGTTATMSAPATTTVPVGDVAISGGIPITKAEFRHWLYADSIGYEVPGHGVLVPLYPPDFTACIASARRLYPTVRKWSDARLEHECSLLFRAEEPQMLGLLIKHNWVLAQAGQLGITFTIAQARHELLSQLRTARTTLKEEVTNLRREGLSLADELWLLQADQLRALIVDHFTAPVTSAEIASYYAAHRDTFYVPETATLWLVQANTEHEALEARRDLEAGASWATVTKRYDETTDYGGLMKNQEAYNLDGGVLAHAVFHAPIGKLEGPVADMYGWYDFTVLSRTPRRDLTLAQATPQIRQTLRSRAHGAAAAETTKVLKQTWQPSTACAALYPAPAC